MEKPLSCRAPRRLSGARLGSFAQFLPLALTIAACGEGATQSTPPPPPPPPERRLHTFSPGSTGFYYGPPTLVGDNIYVGTSRGVLYNVSTTNAFYKLTLTLTKVWEYALGSREVRGGATLDAAGNVYFVVEEGRTPGNTNTARMSLYSLDNTGAFRWSRQIAPRTTLVGMNNPAIAADNTIYIGGDKFYAYDTAGNLRWSYGSSMMTMNAPIIDPAGNIYVSTSASIISLTAGGALRWSVPTAGESYSSPAFSTDYSRLFVGVHDKLYSLQSNTGAKVWEFTPPGMTGVFRATPAVDAQNNVYLGTKSDNTSVFYAVKADGSGLLWQHAVGRDLYSSPALGNDNTVFVGSEGGKLHAFDIATGALKWEAPLDGDATWSSPALTSNGTLYIASMDYLGNGAGVYAIRTNATGYLAGAGSPRFHGGNGSTGRRE